MKSVKELKDATRESSGLHANVLGWVDAGDHIAYRIAVEYWARLADADALLAPRVIKAKKADGRMKPLGEVHRRYSDFLSLHAAIRDVVPGLHFGVKKSLFAALDDNVKQDRVAKLGLYLLEALRLCTLRNQDIPAELLTFLGIGARTKTTLPHQLTPEALAAHDGPTSAATSAPGATTRFQPSPFGHAAVTTHKKPPVAPLLSPRSRIGLLLLSLGLLLCSASVSLSPAPPTSSSVQLSQAACIGSSPYLYVPRQLEALLCRATDSVPRATGSATARDERPWPKGADAPPALKTRPRAPKWLRPVGRRALRVKRATQGAARWVHARLGALLRLVVRIRSAPHEGKRPEASSP